MAENFLNTQLPVFCIQSWAEIMRSKGGTGQAVSWMDWQRLGAFLRGMWPEELPPIMYMEGEFDVSSISGGHDTPGTDTTDDSMQVSDADGVPGCEPGHVMGTEALTTEAVGDWLGSSEDSTVQSSGWHDITERIRTRGDQV